MRAGSHEIACLGVWICLDIVHPLEGFQRLLGLLRLAPGTLRSFRLILLLLSLCIVLRPTQQACNYIATCDYIS